MTSSHIAACVLGALVASYAAADPPERSAAETKRLAALLDKGRALEGHGKHAEAIAAYREYLVTVPDDAVANAELGWAAFQAKDYKQAEAATRLAIAHAPASTYIHDPSGRPRGAALYNLGLIQEANGAAKDAAVSFSESLAVRPSRAVREHLQTLDAGLAAKADPFVPARAPGPFASVRDACRDWLVRHETKPDDTWGNDSSCDKVDPITVKAAKPSAPFEAISAFQMEDRTSLDVAVKLHDGWYLVEYEGKQDRSTAHCGGTKFTVTRLSVEKRVATELHLDYRSEDAGCDHAGNGHGRSWGWDERGTIVIGIGASGRPSFTPPIITAQKEWEQYDGEAVLHMTDATASITWGKNGTFDVTGKVLHPIGKPGQALMPDELDPEMLLGHHIVEFP